MRLTSATPSVGCSTHHHGDESTDVALFHDEVEDFHHCPNSFPQAVLRLLLLLLIFLSILGLFWRQTHLIHTLVSLLWSDTNAGRGQCLVVKLFRCLTPLHLLLSHQLTSQCVCVIQLVELEKKGKKLTSTVTVLVCFILGGGVQVQPDWSIVSCDKVKGCPI